jgi:DNA-binding MarR family transcriptional regulator
MSTTKQPPLLGALLRLCHQELLNSLNRELADAGCSDVSQAQYAVCQQLRGHPDGLRITQMAAYAGITKPSMSVLVDGLERSGYVERVADPSDQRAQRVRFTARGRHFAETAMRAVTRVERHWAERVGARDVEALRRILRALVDSRPGVPTVHDRQQSRRNKPEKTQ